MDRGFLSNIEPPDRDGVIGAAFRDVRQLQIMTDKLKQLVHLIELNRRVCEGLDALSKRMLSRSRTETVTSFQTYETMMGNCMFQLETNISRLKSMITRADGVSSFLSAIRSAIMRHVISLTFGPD